MTPIHDLNVDSVYRRIQWRNLNFYYRFKFWNVSVLAFCFPYVRFGFQYEPIYEHTVSVIYRRSVDLVRGHFLKYIWPCRLK